MASVKKVTGNTKEAEELRKFKSAGVKPGKSKNSWELAHFLIWDQVTVISKVMLSSRHGPGIQISDY